MVLLFEGKRRGLARIFGGKPWKSWNRESRLVMVLFWVKAS